MGFWTYFRDELGWPLIFRPGPLAALVEGLARALDDVRADVLWFRKQFNPATCEDAHVVPHAGSRGLDRHRLETDAGYRGRAEQAFAWQALGGGQRGVPGILKHMGYPGCEARNMRDEDPERWAEFKLRVPVPETGLDVADYELLSWAVGDVKPARSILAGLESEGTVAGGVGAAGTLLLGSVVTLGPEIPAETSTPCVVKVAGYIHGISTATLGE